MGAFIYFTNTNVRDKPEKWETSFVAILLKYEIGNSFRPPKSSMGTLFVPGSSKNQSFFTKKYRIPSIGVPQYNVHQSVFLGSCAGSAVKTHSFTCIEVRKLQKYQVEKNYFFPKIFIFSFSRFGIFHFSHIYS